MHSIEDLHEALSAARATRIGLVPTMGAFHDGHLALMRQAVSECGTVVVSSFVNPKQFGAGEDFAGYPREPERDAQLAQAEDVDVLFEPSVDEMFGCGFETEVRVPELSRRLCGAFRPGHFDGVTTVVTRLFGLVRPQIAYFGAKDFQQTVIIRRVVDDLVIPVQITVCPTVRAADGLALSSRNTYLSEAERAAAPGIYKTLTEARGWYLEGETEAPRLLGRTSAALTRIAGFRLQYLNLVDPVTLADLTEARPGAVIALAGYFGHTRLIDNLQL